MREGCRLSRQVGGGSLYPRVRQAGSSRRPHTREDDGLRQRGLLLIFRSDKARAATQGGAGDTALKRMLADAESEKAALKEIASETSESGAPADGRPLPDEDDEGE